MSKERSFWDTYIMLRKGACGREIALPGHVLAGLLPGNAELGRPACPLPAGKPIYVFPGSNPARL